MSGRQFSLKPLAVGDDRSVFRSGSDRLDRYLHEQVMQDVCCRVAACFVALMDDGHIAGYYTLASASVALSALPVALVKKLPRYPSVLGVRMGRLAIDHRFKGQGLGGALLADAIERAARAEIAAYALLVDAKDDRAAAFYLHHGFIALPDASLTLFLPLASAATVR